MSMKHTSRGLTLKAYRTPMSTPLCRQGMTGAYCMYLGTLYSDFWRSDLALEGVSNANALCTRRMLRE